MNVRTVEIRTGKQRIVEITDYLTEFAREANTDGLLHAFLPHATCGLALIETHAGTEQDLEAAIDRLLPPDERYHHSHGSRGHGASHVLPAFVSPSLVLPVERGEVVLGTWQSVVLVDPNVDNAVRSLRLSLLAG